MCPYDTASPIISISPIPSHFSLMYIRRMIIKIISNTTVIILPEHFKVNPWQHIFIHL